LGEYTIGNANQNGADNRIDELYWDAFTNPNIGKLVSMRAYIYLPQANRQLAIYDSSKNQIAVTEVKTVGSGWDTYNFVGDQQKVIDPGTVYLAVLTGTGWCGYSSGGDIQHKDATSYPANLGSGSTINATISCQCTLEQYYEGSADLACSFELPIYEDLKAEFTVRYGFEEIKTVFNVGQGSSGLFSKFEVGQNSVELNADFTIRRTATLDRFADAVIRHISTAELGAETNVRNVGAENLLTYFIVRHSSTTSLFSKLFVINAGEVALNAEADIRQTDTVVLETTFIVRHDSTVGVHSDFTIRRTATLEIPSDLTVRHSAEENLSATFGVCQWCNIFSKMIIRHSAVQQIDSIALIRHTDTVELDATFSVRHSKYIRRKIFCKFIVRHAAADNLAATLKVSRRTKRRDIPAEFTVNQSNQTSTVFADFYIRPRYLVGEEMLISGQKRRMVIK